MSRTGARVEESGNELRLDCPATHAAGRSARRLVRRFAEVRGFSADEVQRLELVASELLSNAVDHGGGHAAREAGSTPRQARMKLVLRVETHGWALSVSDEGGGDPEALRAQLRPDAELPDLEDERGRGFFLMLQLSDEFAVERSADGRGLTFSARRRVADEEPPAAGPTSF